MSKNMADRRNKSRSQLTKADKQAIKEEHAAFIAKINSAQPNEHQAAIYAAAQSGSGRYVVLAGPGSGKTFTSIKMSTLFTGTAIYFSYNKKIQIDTNKKLVAIDSRMMATTAHAFGLGCLQAYSQGMAKVDEGDTKYAKIVEEYLSFHWNTFYETVGKKEASEVLRLNAYMWAVSLVHYAQVTLLTEPTSHDLARLVEEFDLTDILLNSPVWPLVCHAVNYALEAGLQQFLGPKHLVSFDDMIYLPNVIQGVPVRQYDHVIVDEAQDTSRASLELMLKACHEQSQVFFVGDKKQSIYAFAGAAFDSIDQIIERLDADTLLLRVCYRCGSNIVDLANQLDGQLMSAGGHTGNVEVIGPEYLDQLQPGDAVLARTTAKLVQACLKVLQTGKRAKVLGRNLGQSIAALVTILEAMRVSRGRSALASNLSNLLSLLKEYHQAEAQRIEESKEHPEMALSMLNDKVDTVKAFFEAYMGKCTIPSLRVPDDPKCDFNKTAQDFKLYIVGLFSEDDSARDSILFMTVHRSKGGEWENVYIIGTDEFPHPKAKSERQQQQEENLMYVAVTRAVHNLYFVGAPFSGITVPGYESAEEEGEEQTPPDLQEIHSTTAIAIQENRESVYDVLGFEDDDPAVVEALFTDALREDVPLHHDAIESETVTVVEVTPEPLAPGKFSRVLAIEVLCPACNGACIDPTTGSLSITYDLVGHTVVCSTCGKACIVPLNAFTLQGDVIAREKLAAGVTNAKREKKGRTQKERKSKAGRKTKGKGVRQPMQLSLDLRVINTLNAMGVNKSELFEELLQQYEPFLDAWAELGNDAADDEIDHDEIEENEEE